MFGMNPTEAKTYYEINSATVTRYAPKAHGQCQYRTETQQTYRIAVDNWSTWNLITYCMLTHLYTIKYYV